MNLKIGAKWNIEEQARILKKESEGLDKNSGRIYSVKDGYLHVEAGATKGSRPLSRAIASFCRFFKSIFNNYDMQSSAFKVICTNLHIAGKIGEHNEDIHNAIEALDERLRDVAHKKGITDAKLRSDYGISTPSAPISPRTHDFKEKMPSKRASQPDQRKSTHIPQKRLSAPQLSTTPRKSGTVHEPTAPTGLRKSHDGSPASTGEEVAKTTAPLARAIIKEAVETIKAVKKDLKSECQKIEKREGDAHEKTSAVLIKLQKGLEKAATFKEDLKHPDFKVSAEEKTVMKKAINDLIQFCNKKMNEEIRTVLTKIEESAAQKPQNDKKWLEDTISNLSKDIAAVSKWRECASDYAHSKTVDHTLNNSRTYLLMRSLEYADSVIHSGSDIPHAKKILNNVREEINKITDEDHKALFRNKLEEMSAKQTTATTTTTTPKSRRESMTGGEIKKPAKPSDIGIEFTSKDFEGFEGVTDAEMERTTELEELFKATDEFFEASIKSPPTSAENQFVLDDVEYLDKVLSTLNRLTALSKDGKTDARIERAKKHLNKLAGSYIEFNVAIQKDQLYASVSDDSADFDEVDEIIQSYISKEKLDDIVTELTRMGDSLKDFRLKPDLSKRIRETIDECMREINKPLDLSKWMREDY